MWFFPLLQKIINNQSVLVLSICDLTFLLFPEFSSLSWGKCGKMWLPSTGAAIDNTTAIKKTISWFLTVGDNGN